MSKIRVFLAGAVLAALASSPASADEASNPNSVGRFGIGYDATLGGVGGLSARFQVAKNFGIQSIVSFDRVSFDDVDGANNPNSPSVTDIGVAVRGDVGLAFTNKASLGVIFGVDFAWQSIDPDDPMQGSQTASNFAFEVGLRPEYHFTNWFSVHGEVGLVFALLDGASRNDAGAGIGAPNEEVNGNGDSGNAIVFGVGDVVGTAGFTFWFK